VYPNHPFTYTFLDEEFDKIYRHDTNGSKIIRTLSILAIFISCLGLFSLSSYSTTMRTKEIGVRKALGASTFAIIKQLVMEFVRLVMLANLLAWPLAWLAATHWLNTFAYRTDTVAVGRPPGHGDCPPHRPGPILARRLRQPRQSLKLRVNLFS